MRRLITVATLALLLSSIPLIAQRGGGHAAGGMHSGASMGARGFSGGGARSFAGGSARGFSGRSFSGRSFSGRSPAGRGFSGRSNIFSRNNFGRSRSRVIVGRGFGNCFGCWRGLYGYPWGYSGFYDPSWWGDSGYSYDQDRAREIDQANQMNAQSLDEQRMRRDDRDQDRYSRRDAQPREEAKAETPEPATMLVFRDQRKQEVQNYAIVGQTLFSFSGPRTQKIPIADLDLTATAKANDARGVDFKVPAGAM
jgi:hypothetical protein